MNSTLALSTMCFPFIPFNYSMTFSAATPLRSPTSCIVLTTASSMNHALQIDLRTAALELALECPADVVRNGAAFVLRQSRKNGQNQFTSCIQRIDILFFKENAHRRIELSKLTDTS